MKVLIFVQDVGLGGVLRQTSLLTDGLQARGHEVSVVGLVERDREWQYSWDSASPLPVLYRESSPGPLARALRLIRTVAWLRRLIREKNFSVVYALQGNVVRLISWFATRGVRTPLVWGIRGAGERQGRYWRSWKRSVVLKLSRWVSFSIALTIANSEAGHKRHELTDTTGCSRQLMIHNGFDIDRFKPDPEQRARVRREWGVGGEKLIGIAARLAPSKGHGVFFDAARLLLDRRSDVRFVVIGDGPERKSLLDRSDRLGLEKDLIWAGARADMPAVHNALDVLCSASISGEGCPNVIGEAMACGVPCVVTDAGDSAALVGDLGEVVPRGDAHALAGALAVMLEKLDRIDRRRLRDHIVTNFSVEAMVDRTEKALLEVAGASRRIDTGRDAALPSVHA